MPKSQSDHYACDATFPAALLIYISSRPSHSYELLIIHVKPLAIDHQLDREPLPKTRNVDSSHGPLRAANGPLALDLEGVNVAEFSRFKDEPKVSFTYVPELCNEAARQYRLLSAHVSDLPLVWHFLDAKFTWSSAFM